MDEEKLSNRIGHNVIVNIISIITIFKNESDPSLVNTATITEQNLNDNIVLVLNKPFRVHKSINLILYFHVHLCWEIYFILNTYSCHFQP